MRDLGGNGRLGAGERNSGAVGSWKKLLYGIEISK